MSSTCAHPLLADFHLPLALCEHVAEEEARVERLHFVGVAVEQATSALDLLLSESDGNSAGR